MSSRREEIRQRNLRIVNYIKKQIGCKDCKTTDPRVLDFHHKDPTKKITSVSKLAWRTYRLGGILNEIAKCTVLCSNCHRKRELKKNEIIRQLKKNALRSRRTKAERKRKRA